MNELWKVEIFGPAEVFGEPEATRLIYEDLVQTFHSSDAARITLKKLPIKINGDLTILVKASD